MKRLFIILIISQMHSLGISEILKNPTLEWPYLNHSSYGDVAAFWNPWGIGSFEDAIIDLSNFPSQKVHHMGYGYDSYGPCGIYQDIDGLELGTLYRVSARFMEDGYLDYTSSSGDIFSSMTYSINQIGVDPNGHCDPYQVSSWSPEHEYYNEIVSSRDYFQVNWRLQDVYFRATHTTATVVTRQFGIVEGYRRDESGRLIDANWEIDCYVDDLNVTPIEIGPQSTIEAVEPVQANGFDLCEVLLTVMDVDGVPLPNIQWKDIQIECSGAGNQIIQPPYYHTDENGRIILWITSTVPETKTVQAWVFGIPLPEVQVEFYSPRGWVRHQEISFLPSQYFENRSPVVLAEDRAMVASPDEWLGSVQIYRLDEATWETEAILWPSESTDFVSFGGSIGLDGTNAIVGVGDGYKSSLSPVAYIYEFDDYDWNQQIRLISPGGASDFEFGGAVSIRGDWAAVSGITTDGFLSSCVYIYKNNDGYWSHHTTLIDPNDGIHDNAMIQMSDSWLVIGYGYGEIIHLYEQENNDWIYRTSLKASEAGVGGFRDSMSLDHSCLYVNAMSDSSLNTFLEYRYSEGQWQLYQKWTDDYHSDHGAIWGGFSVFGNWAIAGLPSDWWGYSGYLYNPAEVTIYYRNQSGWVAASRLYRPTLESYGFGNSVAINDEWILINSPFEAACYFMKHTYQPADLNEDDHIDTLDLATIAQSWCQSDCQNSQWCQGADLNHSGRVDNIDFQVIAQQWLWSVVP